MLVITLSLSVPMILSSTQHSGSPLSVLTKVSQYIFAPVRVLYPTGTLILQTMPLQCQLQYSLVNFSVFESLKLVLVYGPYCVNIVSCYYFSITHTHPPTHTHTHTQTVRDTYVSYATIDICCRELGSSTEALKVMCYNIFTLTLCLYL